MRGIGLHEEQSRLRPRPRLAPPPSHSPLRLPLTALQWEFDGLFGCASFFRFDFPLPLQWLIMPPLRRLAAPQLPPSHPPLDSPGLSSLASFMLYSRLVCLSAATATDPLTMLIPGRIREHGSDVQECWRTCQLSVHETIFWKRRVASRGVGFQNTYLSVSLRSRSGDGLVESLHSSVEACAMIPRVDQKSFMDLVVKSRKKSIFCAFLNTMTKAIDQKWESISRGKVLIFTVEGNLST